MEALSSPTDAGSIAAAVSVVTETHGRLDILVNNAGIIRDDFEKKPSEQTLDSWRDTFETNVFGLVATTKAFLPLLRKSLAGRIVNVSSLLGSLALHSDPASPIYDAKVPAYNISKTAVNAWTYLLTNCAPRDQGQRGAPRVGEDRNEQQWRHGGHRWCGSSVAMALLDDAGPSGAFVHLGEVLPW